jgi:predicted secreted acid phosphatase
MAEQRPPAPPDRATDGGRVARVVDYSKRPKEVAELAKKWLACCAEKHGGYDRLVVVFDIDETLLFTSKNETHITHHPLGYALYKHCREKHVDIHLVTARVGDRNSRKFVREQLHVLGFDGYRSLYMVNAKHQEDATPAKFKGKCRRTIASETQKVLALNVGDQMTDIFADFEAIADDVAQLIGPGTYYFLEVDGDQALRTLKFTSDKDTYV